MHAPWRQSVTPIGLDLGSRWIKAVQLRRTREGFAVAAAVKLRRAQSTGASPAIDTDSLRLLCDAMRRQRFVGRDVVIACPATYLHTDLIELPPIASGAPIAQIARTEIKRSGKFEDAPFEMAYWELPQSSRASTGCCAMAVASLDSKTEPIIQSLESIELEVVAIDVQVAALARICSAAFAQTPDGILAILDWGASGATIALSHRGQAIYQRAVPDAAIETMTRSIGDELELAADDVQSLLSEIGAGPLQNAAADSNPFESPRAVRFSTLVQQHLEELTREVEAALTYASHRYPQATASELLLMGGGAHVAHAAEQLGARLPVCVRAVKLDDLCSCSGQCGECGAGSVHVLAAGLARNGAH